MLDGCRTPNRRIAPVGEVFQHERNAFFKRDLRRPAEQGADTRRIPESAVWLTRTFGYVNDVTTQQFHQAIDTVVIAAAYVHRNCADIGSGSCQKCPDDIGDVCEITCLAAITDDSERLAVNFSDRQPSS